MEWASERGLDPCLAAGLDPCLAAAGLDPCLAASGGVVLSILAPFRRNLRADADLGVAPGGVFACSDPPSSLASCSRRRVSKSLSGAPVTGVSSRSIAEARATGAATATGGGGAGASRSGGSLAGDAGVTAGRLTLSISLMGARASGFTRSQVTDTRIPASSARLSAPGWDARSARGILFFFLPADDGATFASCIGAKPPSDDSLRAGAA